ncbi:hypothetical protein EYF80_025172 [Liparis tanakae]|uniref:Uncharacterized protein n=1 Tax=Liparis tanakae TaxID=230148 RepID=A0A4Z2HI97_9TELE|nr:hypothetical protein EYF80_025172 [Liparis tanakae]
MTKHTQLSEDVHALGCVRACGGVRRGDGPRGGGVGLGRLGLCCCFKNGLSKRPGGRDDTKPHPHTHTWTHTDAHGRTRRHAHTRTKRK